LLMIASSTLVKSMEKREKEPVQQEESIQQFQYWDLLPAEIKAHILSFIPPIATYQDWIHLLSVNKEFNELASSQDFLNNFAKELYKNNPKRAEALLEGAINNGNASLTKALIKTDEKLKKEAVTRFISAANEGNLDLVKLLHQAGIDVNAQGFDNTTALMATAFSGPQLTIAQWLIEHGADVTMKKSGGFSALIWASMNGHKELVDLFIESKADINEKDDGLYTPLVLAVIHNHYDIAKTLLEHGADPNATALYGTTPLLAALNNKDSEMVKLLIEHGADVDQENKYDPTARELIELNFPGIIKLA
jgi:ankyrin repeat protein